MTGTRTTAGTRTIQPPASDRPRRRTDPGHHRAIRPVDHRRGDRARQEGDELLDGDQHSRLPRGEPEVRAHEQGQDEVDDLLGAAG